MGNNTFRKRGIFIVFEGGEGAGKTLTIEWIYYYLKNKGINVIKTREPGGSVIAEKIRGIIVDKENTEIDPRTEALLFAAARRQHLVEKVIPYLEQDYIVLCDRFVDSSLAYQGYARGLGINKIYDVNKFAIDTYMPDMVLWLDIPPKVGLQRISDNNRDTNRIDLESMKFHVKVREGYEKVAETYNYRRIVRVNANCPKEEVFQSCKEYIDMLIDEYRFIEEGTTHDIAKNN